MRRMFERGNPVTVVCDRHGISESTFYDWMAESDAASDRSDSNHPLFGFSERVRTSRAKAEEKALKIVWDAAVGGKRVVKTSIARKELVTQVPDPDHSPLADDPPPMVEADRKLLQEETTVTEYITQPDASKAIWFLERRNRPEWGRTVGITGGDGRGPVEVARSINLADLSDDDLAQLEAILDSAAARRTAAGGGGPG